MRFEIVTSPSAPNSSLQPTVTPLRGLPSAELQR